MTELQAISLWNIFSGALATSLIFTLLLVIKTLRDYSTAGPNLHREIIHHYRLYAAWAVGRLTFWAFLIALYWSMAGSLLYLHLALLTDLPLSTAFSAIAATIMLAAAIAFQFLRYLLYCPAVIAASSHYRMSRFYKPWKLLTPSLFRRIYIGLIMTSSLLIATSLGRLLIEKEFEAAMILALLTAALIAVALLASWKQHAKPVNGCAGSSEKPNILMIGSDTLRVDRLGVSGYKRPLTPNLDGLAKQGAWFENCYIPCGRTAPSLLSLLTGTWPHTHGVRDNFVADAESSLGLPSLPGLLSEHGYKTAAISDWCGADLGKFDLGFDELDLPTDPWNLRYLLRQGPKDLRLFLSLFLRNRIGKRLVPEIYYLGGVPLTDALGSDAKHAISRFAKNEQPFLLNVFFSTTHPPFGSEYPYYSQFSDPDYSGESKFVMARLADPFDIIRRQGEPRKEFDLDQILDLYDGCVQRFDAEAGKLLEHLTSCGLGKNTIIVIYSDHGMEFFEHGSWGQGNSVLGDHSSRIPMIIYDPRLPGPNHIKSIIRSVDIMPTLLELCGIPIPASLDGISLASSLNGSPIPQLAAYTESGIWLTDLPGMPEEHIRYPDLLEILDVKDYHTGTFSIKEKYQDLVIEAKDRMVRLGRWKLTYQPTRTSAIYRLFDVESDPGCCTDVITYHPEIAHELKSILINWLCQDKQRTWKNEHMIRIG